MEFPAIKPPFSPQNRIQIYSHAALHHQTWRFYWNPAIVLQIKERGRKDMFDGNIWWSNRGTIYQPGGRGKRWKLERILFQEGSIKVLQRRGGKEDGWEGGKEQTVGAHQDSPRKQGEGSQPQHSKVELPEQILPSGQYSLLQGDRPPLHRPYWLPPKTPDIRPPPS